MMTVILTPPMTAPIETYQILITNLLLWQPRLRTTKTPLECLVWPWQTRILKTVLIPISLTAALTSEWTFNPTMTSMLKEYLTTMNLPMRLYVWPTRVILKMKTTMVNFKNVVDQFPPQSVITIIGSRNHALVNVDPISDIKY